MEGSPQFVSAWPSHSQHSSPDTKERHCVGQGIPCHNSLRYDVEQIPRKEPLMNSPTWMLGSTTIQRDHFRSSSNSTTCHFRTPLVELDAWCIDGWEDPSGLGICNSWRGDGKLLGTLGFCHDFRLYLCWKFLLLWSSGHGRRDLCQRGMGLEGNRFGRLVSGPMASLMRRKMRSCTLCKTWLQAITWASLPTQKLESTY